jgi:hypothetical protein
MLLMQILLMLLELKASLLDLGVRFFLLKGRRLEVVPKLLLLVQWRERREGLLILGTLKRLFTFVEARQRVPRLRRLTRMVEPPTG